MKKLIVNLIGLYLNLLAYVAPEKAGLRGFLLFCRPFKSPFNPKQQSFFNTADAYVIKHDDHDVKVYRWGNGPKKIVFLHGWQSHTYRWKSYIEALPKDAYTIYSLDAPGHGGSSGNFLSVPLYSGLIQQFLQDLGEVETVVAHSLGGFSLLYSLHQFPLLPVRKIILMGAPGEATDFINVFRITLGLSERTLNLVRDHFVSMYEVGPEYFSAPKFAATVKVPGLLIHDQNDLEAPYEHAVQINKAWKRSQLLATKGLGHNLKSAAVVAAVVNFIAQADHLVHDQYANELTDVTLSQE
jgi:pimeloyl-ACP methyl ester carboxylesterase